MPVLSPVTRGRKYPRAALRRAVALRRSPARAPRPYAASTLHEARLCGEARRTADTVATLAGSPIEFPAGQHGEIYLTGLDAVTVVQLAWRAQHCSFAVRFEATADPLPDLGTFVCRGIAR